MENRARLLEVAAFLDRIDRCEDAEAARQDYRYAGLAAVLVRLASGESDRIVDLHRQLSDPTDTPLESAAGLSGAAGAWPGASS
ncbi:MAG: hypothetical protein ACQGVK_21165 [Myxococcota bacterium]